MFDIFLTVKINPQKEKQKELIVLFEFSLVYQNPDISSSFVPQSSIIVNSLWAPPLNLQSTSTLTVCVY